MERLLFAIISGPRGKTKVRLSCLRLYCNGLLATYRREIIVKSYDWVSPYLTHSTSKLTNIIKHGYNVCRLKCNENQGRMAYCNEKHIKTKLTYSVIPLFRYSVFRVFWSPGVFMNVGQACNNKPQYIDELLLVIHM